jgi:two-component system sensor histidine kinase CpxA
MQPDKSDANFEALKKNRSVQLINTERQDWDCRITGNNELIHSAIENIIRNAVRYTNDNTTVEISLDHIASPTNTAIITIRDHGPGIPDDQLSNIFQPFFRISESRDRESGGVGLGLSIAERAIKSHGGSIAAKNAEDGGLLVEIRLPF